MTKRILLDEKQAVVIDAEPGRVLMEAPGIVVPGYDPNGSTTMGAGYAREHPEVKPDNYVPGVEDFVAGRRGLRFVTGREVRLLGMVCLVMAVKPWGLVLDTREAEAAVLDAKVRVSQLILWRSVYWRVIGVHGVFVTLGWWGTRVGCRPDWRLSYQGGQVYAHPRAKER